MDEVVKGISLIWNNKFKEAEALFAPHKDDAPRYALHYAESIFLQSFITADINDTVEAIARLENARKLAEQHIKILSQPIAGMDEPERLNCLLDARLCLGDALYMFAVLQLTRDSKVKGAYNLRRSWKSFDAATKEVNASASHTTESDKPSPSPYDPELRHCLKFGVGFFLFATSIIPAKFLKLIELVGFKADRDLGLKYMRECHEHQSVRTPFATMVQLSNNLLLPRGLANVDAYLREADALISESMQRYPDGSLFQVMASHCARKQCKVDEGIKFMKLAISNCKDLPQPPLIYEYELANCYSMKMDFNTAAQLYEKLAREEHFQVRAFCAMQHASLLAMQGKHDQAKAVFQRVPDLAAKKASQIDPVIGRQAKRYLQNGAYFSGFELLYMKRDLAKMIPSLQSALQLLDQIAKKHTKATTYKFTPAPLKSKRSFTFSALTSSLTMTKPVPGVEDDRAAYLLLKGAMLKALDNHKGALPCFEEVVEMGKAKLLVEKFYLPYCYYEYGESLYHLGKCEEAAVMMKRSSSFSGYDWEDPLKVRLRVTVDQLRKGGVAVETEEDTTVEKDECDPECDAECDPELTKEDEGTSE